MKKDFYKSIHDLKFYEKKKHPYDQFFIKFLKLKGLKTDDPIFVCLTNFLGYTFTHFELLRKEYLLRIQIKGLEQECTYDERPATYNETICGVIDDIRKLNDRLTLSLDVVIYNQVSTKWNTCVAIDELLLISEHCFPGNIEIQGLLFQFDLATFDGNENQNSILADKRSLFESILNKKDFLLENGNKRLLNETIERLKLLDNGHEKNDDILKAHKGGLKSTTPKH